MIKADIYLNGEFWKTAELPGMEKHFQVIVVNPAGGRGTPIDVYVEDDKDLLDSLNWIQETSYVGSINRPDLEVNDEYTLRKKL